HVFLRVGGRPSAAVEDVPVVQPGPLAQHAVRRHAVVAVVGLADVQGQLLPHPCRQDAVAECADEAQVGFEDGRRDGHRAGHVGDEAQPGLHGVEQFPGPALDGLRVDGGDAFHVRTPHVGDDMVTTIQTGLYTRSEKREAGYTAFSSANSFRAASRATSAASGSPWITAVMMAPSTRMLTAEPPSPPLFQ